MQILTCSEKIKHEYCCTVVRIGECFPIEGADRIQRTLVNGMDMVIQKSIQPGDIMIYAANETQLNSEFLACNNLFDISNYTLNRDYKQMQDLIDNGKKDEAKLLCGFFTAQCRVKMLKLKGTYSFGFLFSPESLAAWKSECANIKFEKLVGADFDTVCDKLFVKAYVPLTKNASASQVKTSAQDPNKFDRLVEGNFSFHYDSIQLQRTIDRIKPTDVITVTPKLHGTSAIYTRTKCKIPITLSWSKRLWNQICKLLHLNGRYKYCDYYIGYDNMYASRTILKNRYIYANNKLKTPTSDIWGYFNNLLAPYLGDGVTVYGEIIGYMPESSRFIQKGYDYKCAVGESTLVPYRLVHQVNGISKEFDMPEVVKWTKDMLRAVPALKGVLTPMPVLYHGTLQALYPGIAIDNDWHNNVLAALKADQTTFGMEMNEPLCWTKVPREGICIRIDGDKVLENFKLKCSKFLNRESKAIDAGEIDIEMQENEY